MFLSYNFSSLFSLCISSFPPLFSLSFLLMECELESDVKLLTQYYLDEFCIAIYFFIYLCM